jgi:hypothetical protein
MTSIGIHSTAGLSVLDNRTALRLDHHRPVEVQVIAGTAYLTQEGDMRDYILRSGESLTIHDRGEVVVQGLPFTQFRVL